MMRADEDRGDHPRRRSEQTRDLGSEQTWTVGCQQTRVVGSEQTRAVGGVGGFLCGFSWEGSRGGSGRPMATAGGRMLTVPDGGGVVVCQREPGVVKTGSGDNQRVVCQTGAQESWGSRESGL